MSTLEGAAGAQELVYPNEKKLFAIALVISLLVWLLLLVGTFGVALVWVGAAFIFYLFVQSALISYLQGTGTKITAQQFPDLHQRIEECCAKLGVSPAPDAYLLHADGAFNAFAARFLGRHFIVLYSDVVDALEAEPKALNFYIGHELGHIRQSHLIWGPLLFPASILPLLGAAYSRAREYTCDLHGVACCETRGIASKGLATLAAGGRRWQSLDAQRYVEQAEKSGGFWMSFHELTGSYPWTVKRMARVLGADASVPSRNVFAWILAAFVPRMGFAGGAGGVLVTVAIIGILAAVAIPAYQDYTVRAKVSGVMGEARTAANAVEAFYYRTGNIPPSLEAAGVVSNAGSNARDISVDERGVIRVELGFGAVEGKTFVMVPKLDSNKKVFWTCMPETVEPKYLPQACRNAPAQ